MNEGVVRHHVADAHVRYLRVAPCNDEIKDMSKVVCWLSDVLHVAKQLKHLCKVYAICIVDLVYMYVEIATEYHWTVERRQPLEHRRQLVEKHCTRRLTARPVYAE